MSASRLSQSDAIPISSGVKDKLIKIDDELKSSCALFLSYFVGFITFGARRNALTSINRLPAEVLMEIFRLFAFDFETKDGLSGVRVINKNWVSASRVCHYWRLIALQFPVGWYTFDPYRQNRVKVDWKYYKKANLSNYSTKLQNIYDDYRCLCSYLVVYCTIRILELRYKRNELVPINRLPAEIMGNIFTLISHDKDDPGSWDWIAITHVCYLWRTVAHGTPALWSCIYRQYPLERTRLSLALCKNTDLKVFFSQSNSQSSKRHATHAESLQLILKALHRTRELHILGKDETWDKIGDLLQQPSPRLTVLNLSRVDKTGALPTLHFPVTLKEVSLRNFITPQHFKLDFSPGLTSLTMSYITLLSAADVLQILRTCSQLQYLDIMSSISDEIPTKAEEAILSSLRTIKFHCVHVNVCAFLLRHLTIPENADWSILCKPTPTYQESIIPPFFRPLLLQDIQTDTLSISFGKDYLTFKTIRPSDEIQGQLIKTYLHFSWNEAVVNFGSLFSEVVQFIRQSYWRTSLTLEITMGEADYIGITPISTDMWCRLFQTVPLLENLAVGFNKYTKRSTAEEEFAMALSVEPDDSLNYYGSQSRHPVPCPFLGNLFVRVAQQGREPFFKTLADSLRHRALLEYGIQKLWINEFTQLKRTHIKMISPFVKELVWPQDVVIDEDIDFDDDSDDDDLISSFFDIDAFSEIVQ